MTGRKFCVISLNCLDQFIKNSRDRAEYPIPRGNKWRFGRALQKLVTRRKYVLGEQLYGLFFLMNIKTQPVRCIASLPFRAPYSVRRRFVH